MTWIVFLVSAAVLVAAAIYLSKNADVIAKRTGLGGAFVGTLLLASATSLPELLTAVNSINQGEPNLSGGTFFGSAMFNMALIGVLDLFYRQGRLLHRVAISHALTAGVVMLLLATAVFFIQADLDVQLGIIGGETLVIFAFYLMGAYLIQQNSRLVDIETEISHTDTSRPLPLLGNAIVKFALAAGVLIFVVPVLVTSSIEIAEITGLTTGFVGTALLAFVTSLPEVVATFSALRFKAYDMALGNLFGANLFNMFALGIADLFYTQGSVFAALDPSLGFAGILALMMTAIALVGNLARVERRLLGILEIDALLLLLTYFGGLWFLYQRGIGV
jgi:cation:H+ antiporter